MSYISQAATTIWLWIYWSAAMLFRVTALALGLCVLVIYLAPDFIPKRRSKPLTSQAPSPRLLPRPIREGSDIFVIMPDGTRVDMEPLQAKLYAEEWYQAVAGAFVYEKTRIRVDESR